MAGTPITTASLLMTTAFKGKFGVLAETGITAIILQDISCEKSGKEIPPVTNEVGAEIGTGVMGGNISNITGTYLLNGTTTALSVPGTIGAAITLINTFNITDPILLTTFGFKLTHESYATGDFKMVSLTGGANTTTG